MYMQNLKIKVLDNPKIFNSINLKKMSNLQINIINNNIIPF